MRSRYSKTIAAVSGGVLTTLGMLLTANDFSLAQLIVTGVLAALTAAGVYQVPNKNV